MPETPREHGKRLALTGAIPDCRREWGPGWRKLSPEIRRQALIANVTAKIALAYDHGPGSTVPVEVIWGALEALDHNS